MIAFTTPLFLAHSSSGPYFLFGTCCLITALVCVAYLPETRGATLEEVDKAFAVPPWKSLIRKRRLSDPILTADAPSVVAVTATATPASEYTPSIQEVPRSITNNAQAYEMHALNEGIDDHNASYENDSLNEREMELWDTVQMPEVRYNDRWRDVYRLTNVHLAHNRTY